MRQFDRWPSPGNLTRLFQQATEIRGTGVTELAFEQPSRASGTRIVTSLSRFPGNCLARLEFIVTMRVCIEPGNDLVGRFGDTVVLISRSGAADASANDLLGLVARPGGQPRAPATAVAARLAGWVLSNLSGNVAPFGIVTPVPDGVVVFLRGPRALHRQRRRRRPPALRRAGADLGRPDPSRHVRLAGDRRRRGHRRPGGPDIRPAGGRNTRAGVRAERRGRPRSGGSARFRSRSGRERGAASGRARRAGPARACAEPVRPSRIPSREPSREPAARARGGRAARLRRGGRLGRADEQDDWAAPAAQDDWAAPAEQAAPAAPSSSLDPHVKAGHRGDRCAGRRWRPGLGRPPPGRRGADDGGGPLGSPAIARRPVHHP